MNEQLKIALENFLTALKECDAMVKYQNAKELYTTDGKLMALIDQYNVQGRLLRDEGAKEERNDELISQITMKLKELYDEIMESETMQTMQQAEEELTAIINDVNNGMQSIINPGREGGCSGNCSSCSSCH